MRLRTMTASLLACALFAAPPAEAQSVSEERPSPEASDVEVVGHVLEPQQLAPTPERLDQLQTPEGVEVTVFARDLINPRVIAVAEDGTVYVTRRSVGDVVMLRDADGDGTADGEPTVVASRPNMHGIAIDGTTMYLVTIHDLYRTQINDDGTLAPLERLIDDLPDAGQHPNRTIVVGPDSMLYVSVGSTCNSCGEPNPEHATILQVAPDGSSRTIYASGLRNTIGFGFEPESGVLYGMDHGIDWLGDNVQHEELNRIEEGKNYGWPYIYDDGRFNPADEPPGEITHEEWAARSTEPLGLYTPHAAPMQLVFYTGDQLPEAYRGDAFVAMRGSWNRKPPAGYEVVRIDFENGEPVGFEPFITGFLQQEANGWGHLGRLVGIAQAGDGALLLSDDTNGIIYRIAYTGDAQTVAAGAPDAPTNADGANVRMVSLAEPEPSPSPQAPSQLTADLVEAPASLELTSPAFGDSASIPDVYAAEGQNISPPLDWADGPAGTRSYVLLMEDPDASQEPPFVHWIAYNIPADVTELEEGVPGAPQLEKPKGMLQGTNDRGSTGYFGPRPPVNDPAHAYHVQVFALDTLLDLPHGASRAAVLAAIEGHVLAGGTLVGTYQR